VVILTKSGNLELIPFSYIDELYEILTDDDIKEFNNHYQDELRDNPVTFMFETVNLVDVLQKANDDIHVARKIYREELENIFRNFCNIDDAKQPLWIK
jgi:hypothetical protein